MSQAIAKSLAVAQARPRMSARQRQVWKARQMIGMRLEQAREFKARGDQAARLWCIQSALVWREALFA